MIDSIRLRLTLAGLGLVFAAFLAGCGGDDENNDDAPAASVTVVAGESGPGGPLLGGSTSGLPIVGGAADPETPPLAAGWPPEDQPPATTASANGASVEMGIGTFCWTRLCVDKIGVPTKGTLAVARGDTVSVAIPDGIVLNEAASNVFEAEGLMMLDDGSEMWPYPGNPGQAVPFEVVDGSIEVRIDLAPGRYVLAVSMYFESGDSVYGVLLEVR